MLSTTGASACRRPGLLADPEGEVDSDDVVLVAHDDTCTGRTLGRCGVNGRYAASV